MKTLCVGSKLDARHRNPIVLNEQNLPLCESCCKAFNVKVADK